MSRSRGRTTFRLDDAAQRDQRRRGPRRARGFSREASSARSPPRRSRRRPLPPGTRRGSCRPAPASPSTAAPRTPGRGARARRTPARPGHELGEVRRVTQATRSRARTAHRPARAGHGSPGVHHGGSTGGSRGRSTNRERTSAIARSRRSCCRSQAFSSRTPLSRTSASRPGGRRGPRSPRRCGARRPRSATAGTPGSSRAGRPPHRRPSARGTRASSPRRGRRDEQDEQCRGGHPRAALAEHPDPPTSTPMPTASATARNPGSPTHMVNPAMTMPSPIPISVWTRSGCREHRRLHRDDGTERRVVRVVGCDARDVPCEEPGDHRGGRCLGGVQRRGCVPDVRLHRQTGCPPPPRARSPSFPLVAPAVRLRCRGGSRAATTRDRHRHRTGGGSGPHRASRPLVRTPTTTDSRAAARTCRPAAHVRAADAERPPQRDCGGRSVVVLRLLVVALGGGSSSTSAQPRSRSPRRRERTPRWSRSPRPGPLRWSRSRRPRAPRPARRRPEPTCARRGPACSRRARGRARSTRGERCRPCGTELGDAGVAARAVLDLRGDLV